jgi:hypothetical protein
MMSQLPIPEPLNRRILPATASDRDGLEAFGLIVAVDDLTRVGFAHGSFHSDALGLRNKLSRNALR